MSGYVFEAVQKHGLLRKGSKGEAVAILQRALLAAGQSLLVDADFGPITDLAVREFQRTHGLTVDGLVGKATAAALDNPAGTPAQPPAGGPIYVDLMYGLGDSLTSAGMDVLAASIRALSSRLIVHPTNSWRERDAVAARIRRRAANMRNILIGNSMGANAIPMVTAQCPQHTFELCAGYDPTWAWDCPPLTRNIERMLHYKGQFLFSLIGKASYTPAFSSQIMQVGTSTPHGWIDDDLKLHAHTLDGIKARLAA